MALHVRIEDLVSSGMAVTKYGEDVAMKHAAAESRIESAASGWQGASAVAMAAKSAAWSQTTSALLSQLSDHAQGLHNGAQAYAEGEAASSQEMSAVAAQGAAGAQIAKR